MDAWCRGRDWPQAVGWHRSGFSVGSAVFAVVKQLPSAAGGRRHVRAGRRCEHRYKGALGLRSVLCGRR